MTRPEPLKGAAGRTKALNRLSVNDHWVLRQLGVLRQGVFHLVLGGGFDLPLGDVLLEKLGPIAIEVNLFAVAFVHYFKTLARECGLCGVAGCVSRHISRHVHNGERLRVVERVHGAASGVVGGHINLISARLCPFQDRSGNEE